MSKAAGSGGVEVAPLVFISSCPRDVPGRILVFRLDPVSGGLTYVSESEPFFRGTFLAVRPDGGMVYSVAQDPVADGETPVSRIVAFSLDRRQGQLTMMNDMATGGVGPCHVSMDSSGSCILAANYWSGGVAAMPTAADGSLLPGGTSIQHVGSSVDPDRQAGPHAHSMYVSPGNRFALAADLGLDQILVYVLDTETGTLTPHDPPFAKVRPGSGPRHIAFGHGGTRAYVLTEMGSTVETYAWDEAAGTLEWLASAPTLPSGWTGDRNHCAEILLHPNGAFLYASNRGHDSISVFAVSPLDGSIAYVETVSTAGAEPRNFTLTHSGNFLLVANLNSHTVMVFRVDPTTGCLRPTVHSLKVPFPICVRTLPTLAQTTD